MDGSKQRLSQQPVRPSGASGEFGQLKSDGAASVSELREFIGQMHGKSPQEVMGLVAESGLLQSIAVAAAGFAVLLVVFTVGPYLLSGSGDNAADENGKMAADADTKLDSGGEKSAPVAAASDPNAPPANGQKVLDTLGIGDTKVADPKQNPLDNKLDKLLEGID